MGAGPLQLRNHTRKPRVVSASFRASRVSLPSLLIALSSAALADDARPPARAQAPAITSARSAAPAASQPAAPATDPYGFTTWLNGTRARYGLRAVGYDPNLAQWAAVNNGQQQRRGMGHYVLGPARRQNCAVGNVANIGAIWMNSPAHRAALLDPSIRWIGLAGLGAYWTFNAF